MKWDLGRRFKLSLCLRTSSNTSATMETQPQSTRGTLPDLCMPPCSTEGFVYAVSVYALGVFWDQFGQFFGQGFEQCWGSLLGASGTPGIFTCQGKFRDMLGKAPGHVARRHSVLGRCAWVRGVSGVLAWVLGPCLGPGSLLESWVLAWVLGPGSLLGACGANTA